MRNRVKVQNTIISNGVTNGDITISGNTIVNGRTSPWVITLCIFTVLCFVILCLISFLIYNKLSGENMPEDAVIKQGINGGIYWVDAYGKRHYLDREKGFELYRKQQKKIEKEKKNGTP